MRPKNNKHRSGSPQVWKERRSTYRHGPVSNPKQPSPTNRATRRKEKRNG